MWMVDQGRDKSLVMVACFISAWALWTIFIMSKYRVQHGFLDATGGVSADGCSFFLGVIVHMSAMYCIAKYCKVGMRERTVGQPWRLTLEHSK